ncbi:MAG: hypothetical protein ACI8QC_003822, partial [Planctomycetota bacterium]
VVRLLGKADEGPPPPETHPEPALR